jgi:hypothetical protein
LSRKAVHNWVAVKEANFQGSVSIEFNAQLQVRAVEFSKATLDR